MDECNMYTKRNGPLMEGHAVVTSGGNLPCKKVIHAVGPQWQGGRQGEENILYDCVFSHVLRIAVEENFRSIAIPAISSGVYGVPTDVSTSVITEAIKDFLDSQDTVKGILAEIHLFDNRREGGQAFASALKTHFRTTKPVVSQKTNLPMARGELTTIFSQSRHWRIQGGAASVRIPKGPSSFVSTYKFFET